MQGVNHTYIFVSITVMKIRGYLMVFLFSLSDAQALGDVYYQLTLSNAKVINHKKQRKLRHYAFIIRVVDSTISLSYR